MAARTNTDAIRELEKMVAVLNHRMDRAEEDVKRFRDDHSKITESATGLLTRMSLTEDKCTELKKTLDEINQKRWQLALIFLGSILSLLGNIALFFARK